MPLLSLAPFLSSQTPDTFLCGKDIDPDPKKTSFFLAMKQCEGVLLVLDEEATATTRIWCCFEEVLSCESGPFHIHLTWPLSSAVLIWYWSQAMVIQLESEKKLKLDFVTVLSEEVQLITEGLTSEEQATEDEAIEKGYSWQVGKGYEVKSKR